MKEKLITMKNKCYLSIRNAWNKYITYDERTLRRTVLVTTVMYVWLLAWALWLKLNDNGTITLNYSWLSKMTLEERFLYDLIPFQVRFDHFNQIIQFPLNAIVFAPFGVLFNLLFKKKSILRDVLICFCISLGIEILQLFSIIGSFATADLIMNTLGYFIGLAVYQLIFKKLSVKFNLFFFMAVNIPVLAVVIFSVIRTAQNIEPIILILTRQY